MKIILMISMMFFWMQTMSQAQSVVWTGWTPIITHNVTGSSTANYVSLSGAPLPSQPIAIIPTLPVVGSNTLSLYSCEYRLRIQAVSGDVRYLNVVDINERSAAWKYLLHTNGFGYRYRVLLAPVGTNGMKVIFAVNPSLDSPANNGVPPAVSQFVLERKCFSSSPVQPVTSSPL